MFINGVICLPIMKLRKAHIETILFIAVYIFAIYMWTLPFQNNKIPYGEDDAISHWKIADSFVQKDKTYVYLPPYIDYDYGGDNKFKAHTLWYHPPFHTDLAIISSFANGRVVPTYLTNAILASSILISVFFVIRKLFGFLPALLSEFMLAFSMRDIMPYLWGQWPERFGYAFIPLILYCFYVYYTTYSKESSKPIYLYLMAMLFGIQIMVHPLSFFHSLAGIFVLGILLLVKMRKIPFNAKHIGVALLIFIMLFAIFPYQSGNVVNSFMKKSKKIPDSFKFSRLLEWGPNPDYFRGSVPESYFSFREMHGFWTLPFLLIGLLILAVRREKRDIFLIAWLISLYLVLHRDMMGKWVFLHRSLSATAHIFAPITVIGAVSMFSIFKMNDMFRATLKYAGAALIVVLTVVYNIPPAYSTLEQAYSSPIARLNPAQIEVSEWLRQNTPEDQNVSIIGPPQQLMQKVWWIAAYSQRIGHYFEGFLVWNSYKDKPEIARYHLLNDVIVMDYSDIALLSDQRLVEQWLAFEKQTLVNYSLLYSRGNIRVYKYDKYEDSR